MLDGAGLGHQAASSNGKATSGSIGFGSDKVNANLICDFSCSL